MTAYQTIVNFPDLEWPDEMTLVSSIASRFACSLDVAIHHLYSVQQFITSSPNSRGLYLFSVVTENDNEVRHRCILHLGGLQASSKLQAGSYNT